MRNLILLVFLIGSFYVRGSDPYPKNESIDVLHYRFQLELTDSANTLKGLATITILFKKPVTTFELDLINKDAKGLGMQVDAVLQNGKPLSFSHQQDRIKITLTSNPSAGDQVQVVIEYHGIPRDGLIISKNKFGNRTFFGDNWPNRAHHWLPTIDHPSDKATCEFIVTAPGSYQVISNGKKIEESMLPYHRKLTHWIENTPIATKVMVVGIAGFAVQSVGEVDHIPVETWVYPQNREAGFREYEPGLSILDFFHSHLGPYSYEKLANVQSTTRYGGMENASCIFYTENMVLTGPPDVKLIAHEIAHQWFGNSATEKDWHHIWLSEGFATYASLLYAEFAFGHDALVERIKEDRLEVIAYFKKNPNPVVNTNITELITLLNANSYEKGSWVLHMLRHEVGESAFWNGIRKYYRTYRNGNALTSDFQRIMEAESNKDLSRFFDQWLWKGGHPRLAFRWTYDPQGKSVTVSIDQLQPGTLFMTPLDIGVRSKNGTLHVETVKIEGKSQKFVIPAENKPEEVVLDPYTWLLFEAEIKP